MLLGSDLRKQFTLATKLEFDLRVTVKKDGKLSIYFHAKKVNFLFHYSNNSGALDVKIDDELSF